MMLLQFDSFSLAPFPHGQGTGVFDARTYAALLDAWPSEEFYKTLAGPYRKSSLSERCNPDGYAAYIARSWPWRMFHGYLKSETFKDQVFAVLKGHGIKFPAGTYTSRFEFSSLPSDGGCIAPHRDIPSKVLTIVVPMTWDSVPGWGTDILEPLGPIGKDYETPRDAFRAVTSFDYAVNRFGLFVKTDDSWHAIGPLKGNPVGWRRTLTVNVERA